MKKDWPRPVSSADSRVPKYEPQLQEVFNLSRAETAVLCVLPLRGPQTPGELRARTGRMHGFEELSDVRSALQRLIQHEPPEARYIHLLSGRGDCGTPGRGACSRDHLSRPRADRGWRVRWGAFGRRSPS